MKKRYKVNARLVSLLLTICMLTLCIPTMTVAALDTASSIQQIEYVGGWNPKEYPTDGTLYKDRIAVSKTIAPTEDENYFDITLEIVAKPRVIDQSVDVVVVMDVSNTMNYTHQGLSVGEAGYNVKDARLTHAKAAVNSFLDLYAVNENISTDRGFGLVTFNSYANTVVPITTLNTAAKANEIKRTVNNITAPTGNRERFTNIEGGLQLAQNLLKNSDAAFKYIIFITDGFPTTYIQSGRTSTTRIVGYDTYMTGSYNASKVGTDGYFADSVTKKVCTYGVNYSDKAADRADNVAESIKNSGINIFSIGIDVGVQSIPDYLSNAKNTVFTTVDRTSTKHVIGDSTESYKGWLRDSIAGGPMIEEASDTEDIHRYASGNSNTELKTAFENILKDIELIPAETMEEAYTLDPMSDYVEFMNFYDLDGKPVDAIINTRNGKDVATFNTDNETIKWWLTTTQNFYIDDIGNYVLSISYKVRLKNEMDGFEFNKAFETNDKTTFYFKTIDFSTGEPLFGDNSIDYQIPQVEGYYGDFKFTKVDSVTGHPLEGAVFKLEHYGESCHVCNGDAVIEALVASSDEAGVVSFENLPSGHEYRLTEIQAPDGYQPGTDHSVHVAYGKTYLDRVLVTENAPAVIKNQEIIPVTAQLKAHKTLDGRELKENEFTFLLEGEYNYIYHEKAHNDAEGNVVFPSITFEDEGTYTFTVREEKGTDTTVIYDSKIYEVQFVVTVSADGTRYELETKIDGNEVENDTEPPAFEFTNTLRKSIDVNLTSEKLMDGATPDDGMFYFELTDKQTGELLQTKSTVGGKISFDTITYDRVGTYKYTINESHECTDDEVNKTVFFDHTVYDVTVTVTAPDNSDSFSAEVVYSLNGEVLEKVVFVNETRGIAKLTLNALKTLDSNVPDEGQFTFEIREIDGELVERVVNDAEGKITFEPISFNRPGYFVFTLAEVNGEEEGIIYDETIYNIFVMVESHHNLKDYYIDVIVSIAHGHEFEEIARLGGNDLTFTVEQGIVFENQTETTVPTEPVTTVPTEPITTEPTEPITTEPTEPVTTEPTEPVTTKPTEPVTTEPTEPVTTEPTEPVTTKPTEPVTTEPTEPVTTKPTEPVTTEPTEPVTTEPTEPVTTEPTEPVTTEPTEPVTTKPTVPATTKATEPEPETTKATEPTPPAQTTLLPPDTVETGDSTNPLIWAAVLFIGGGIFATRKYYKKKEE